MRLSGKQSKLIGVGTLLLFFIIGIVFMNASKKSLRLQRDLEPTLERALFPEEAVLDTGTTPAPRGETAPAVTPLQTPESAGLSQALVMKKFQRSEIRNGKKIWEIEASSGQYMPENKSALLDDVYLQVLQEKNRTLELWATKAIVFIDGASLSRAEVSGQVKVNYDHAGRLTTDHAIYHAATHSLTAPGPVHIETGMLSIEGEKLEADLEKKIFVLTSKIRTRIKPPSERTKELP